MPASADVVLLGGGLAGLTLALQLRQQDAALRIVVIERHRHPVREAAFKVGESTVEIGAHYLANVLGLREHLDSQHIRKFGFRFFFSDGRTDIDACTELGVSRILPTPSWQIDRGRLENHLGDLARERGIDFIDGAVVRGVDLGEGDAPHAVRCERDGETHTVHARWLVDASGRAGVLKRKLGLAKPNAHDANAVWWRVDGHLDPNDWSDDAQWRDRCTPPDRWRSTNHLCGPGYWVWMIPLSSGAHSIGIVCDAAMHPLETMNSHAKATAWLQQHQPRLADALDASEHTVQDFMFLRHFSYDCAQVFSRERWALTGEAGLFLDPFYSPGSDFIALSNTYIADLIARDRAGTLFGPYTAMYEQLYRSFYENTLTLYQDQYPLFGDAQVMPLKVIWDYTFYWALLAPLYCGGLQCDLGVLGRVRDAFVRGSELNRAMQPLLRAWGERNRIEAMSTPDGRLLDQYRPAWFHTLNAELHEPADAETFVARTESNLRLMARLAAELRAQARIAHPELDTAALDALLACETVDVDAEPLLSPIWYAQREAALEPA
ncbi:NAD(P)/FAD-dependent oxidoreductase [Cognatilysobacter bugurensis]|uniref:NAD(P)/FAD-dependent oxidoreductase n=1 Tax=Cognatilysobacter bugurensis TaxID=543356 RepID=UPI001E5A0691|nr:tryptophan 7-halogenase [Lysobacter bugurensis]